MMVMSTMLGGHVIFPGWNVTMAVVVIGMRDAYPT